MNKEGKLREEIKSILEAIKQPEERILDKHGSNEFWLDLIILKARCFWKIYKCRWKGI